MTTRVVYGPYLNEWTNSGAKTPTNVRSVILTDVYGSSKRVKPRSQLYLNLTNHYRSFNNTTRSLTITRTLSDDKTTAIAPFHSLGTAVVQSATKTTSYNEAVMKLREKLKGEDWNATTFAGELPEAVRYFKKTLTDVVSLYRAVKRGDMRRVRLIRRRRKSQPGAAAEQRMLRELNHAGNTLSGRWLEWRYAISPMMMDLDSMLKAYYTNRSVVKVKRVTAQSMAYERIVSPTGADPFLVRHGSLKTVVGCYVSVTPQMAALKQLGLLNPLATLYELTPLSFVLDWFIPVGQYIGSLDAMVGVQVSSSWTSTLENYSIDIFPKKTYGKTFVSWVDSTGAIKSELKITSVTSHGMHRSAGSTYIRNTPATLTLPPLVPKLSISVNRFLDGLSLLKTSLR